MFNLFNWLKKDNIWDFDGGIHPPEMKLQSSQTPMRIAAVPAQLIIPLQQHLGPEGELLVKVGDYVFKGQPLTKGIGRTVPVHASSSGIVSAIEPRVTAHPSGLAELCVIITTDGKDQWGELHPYPEYTQLTASELLFHIEQAGIAGLGGAGFPTAAKLAGAGQAIKTLIINAAECEPYITADDRLMQEHADEVIEGCRILIHLLNPEQVLIGIEDNKPEAIRALKKALTQHDPLIHIRVIPTKYPSGGAKQLTKILTGKEVPSGARSSQIGVLMQNVGTAVAIKRAIIDGHPLIERVVTVTGEAIQQPGNFWARLGTPVQYLLQQAGFQPQDQQMVIMGGPLMGFTLPDLSVPIVKISNCLLVPTAEEMGLKAQEEACIRCGLCVEACPAGLLPQQLYWFSQGKEHDKAQKHHLFDCIECGACAYVCPSNIPLVQYYRQEKAEIKEIAQEERRANEAKLRFEAKQIRMEREKEAREARHRKAAVQPDSDDKSAVNAALARVKAKQQSAAESITVDPTQAPDNSAVIAAREARKAQARARQAEKKAAESLSTSTEPQTATAEAGAETDPRKAAVAAAIARAKAKKAAQAGADLSAEAAETVAAETTASTTTSATTAPEAATEAGAETDPRKAAVAAAIARVKAKKAAQAGADLSAEAAETTASTTASATTAPEAATEAGAETDPRKAAVAAAIARVKAKKAAQAGADLSAEAAETVAAETTASTTASATTAPEAATEAGAETDPRKAAVAAAIARAKAKKAAQAGADLSAEAAETVAAETTASTTASATTAPEAAAEAGAETDPRKAAVAAAIARVKAKKAAQAGAIEIDTPSLQMEIDNQLSPAADEPIEDETDPRKIAVAAAIARVKAKREMQKHEETSIE
ncbi:electron transport complex subunit RsxC [Moellerella wisconsensis]|uniref:Ion-translocating oxidoreductase complex subunit C n=1 Tax=Moellerella wisconsensis TaxID=158849 RepID=A0A9Q8PZL6_9GAMM|nr:electron transport complex subunit RsxC [Moellerella wisconsensis]UNH29399.1 electron transport complex subunit RsxC [Moellerella wisconsensis]